MIHLDRAHCTLALCGLQVNSRGDLGAGQTSPDDPDLL